MLPGSLRGLLRFYHRRRAPAHLRCPAAPPRPGGAAPASRRAFVVRAVATDAATDTTTSAAKPFKRHERIAAIKVRAPSRARALGRPPLAPTRAPYPNPSRRVPPRPARPHPLRTSPLTRVNPPFVSTQGSDGGASRVGDTVQVRGWVRTVRAQKDLSFVEVNDGSSLPASKPSSPPTPTARTYSPTAPSPPAPPS